MKQLLLTLSILCFVLNSGFCQFDQEPKTNSNTIEESVDKAISKIERIVASIDLEEFFEEDIPELIEDIKPSPERMEEIENGLRESVDRLKEFDSAKLDELVDDIEEGVDEVIEEIEQVMCKRRPQKI